MRYILIVDHFFSSVIPIFKRYVTSAFFSFSLFCRNRCIWQAKRFPNKKTSSPDAQTSCLERFHAILNHRYLKMIGFFWLVKIHLISVVVKTDQSMFKRVICDSCLCFLWLNGLNFIRHTIHLNCNKITVHIQLFNPLPSRERYSFTFSSQKTTFYPY